MQGKIDSTFGTFQRDMFESGLAAEIGPNCFVIWTAIKTHADFNTGTSWPSIRRLASITGLSDKTVQKSIKSLQEAHLLKVIKQGNQRQSNRYVARERLDVRLGDILICRVVIDYVPARIRDNIESVKKSLNGKGKNTPLVDAEIIPGEGFEWDDSSMSLKRKIEVSKLPKRTNNEVAEESEIAQKIELIRQRAALGKK